LFSKADYLFDFRTSPVKRMTEIIFANRAPPEKETIAVVVSTFIPVTYSPSAQIDAAPIN